MTVPSFCGTLDPPRGVTWACVRFIRYLRIHPLSIRFQHENGGLSSVTVGAPFSAHTETLAIFETSGTENENRIFSLSKTSQDKNATTRLARITTWGCKKRTGFRSFINISF